MLVYWAPASQGVLVTDSGPCNGPCNVLAPALQRPGPYNGPGHVPDPATAPRNSHCNVLVTALATCRILLQGHVTALATSWVLLQDHVTALAPAAGATRLHNRCCVRATSQPI